VGEALGILAGSSPVQSPAHRPGVRRAAGSVGLLWPFLAAAGARLPKSGVLASHHDGSRHVGAGPADLSLCQETLWIGRRTLRAGLLLFGADDACAWPHRAHRCSVRARLRDILLSTSLVFRF